MNQSKRGRYVSHLDTFVMSTDVILFSEVQKKNYQHSSSKLCYKGNFLKPKISNPRWSVTIIKLSTSMQEMTLSLKLESQMELVCAKM